MIAIDGAAETVGAGAEPAVLADDDGEEGELAVTVSFGFALAAVGGAGASGGLHDASAKDIMRTAEAVNRAACVTRLKVPPSPDGASW